MARAAGAHDVAAGRSKEVAVHEAEEEEEAAVGGSGSVMGGVGGSSAANAAETLAEVAARAAEVKAARPAFAGVSCDLTDGTWQLLDDMITAVHTALEDIVECGGGLTVLHDHLRGIVTAVAGLETALPADVEAAYRTALEGCWRAYGDGAAGGAGSTSVVGGGGCSTPRGAGSATTAAMRD